MTTNNDRVTLPEANKNAHKIDTNNLKQAKAFWTAEVKRGTTARKGWARIGQACAEWKEQWIATHDGKNAPSTEFGKWTTEHFPGIRNEHISYAQTLSENLPEIEKWAQENCPELATPKHLVTRWKATTATTATPAEGETEVNHQNIEAERKALSDKLFKQLNALTETVYNNLKAGTVKFEKGEKALIENRFDAITALLNGRPEAKKPEAKKPEAKPEAKAA